MGINGLWPAISDAGEAVSLCAFLTELKVRQPNNTIHIGVDISTLMAECTGATLSAGVNGQFVGGAIYILFTKLAAYLECPATFVFVFDGAERPSTKRGHTVRQGKTLHWDAPARLLIEYFGYHIHNAPGEAEAELAQLNQHGFIDGIITSDGDVFVFGAQTVFRSLPAAHKSTFKDEVVLFTSEDLRRKKDLTRGGLLLFALLCGGDYDNGMPNCGAKTALALAKCGFGDQLLTMDDDLDFDVSAAAWRTLVALELSTNSRSMLTKRQPELSRSIPSTFPSQSTLHLYTSPVTSFSPTLAAPIIGNWITREPNLWRLAGFCSQNFNWSTEVLLKKRFAKLVWPGVLLQMFYSPLVIYNTFQQMIATPNAQAPILAAKRQVRRGELGKRGYKDPVRVVASAAGLIVLMDGQFTADTTDKIRVWIPAELLPKGFTLPFKKTAPVMNPAPKKVGKSPMLKGRQDAHAGNRWEIDSSNSMAAQGAPVASGSGTCHQSTSPVASGLGTTHVDSTPPAVGVRWLGLIDLTRDELEDGDDTGTTVVIRNHEVIDLTSD